MNYRMNSLLLLTFLLLAGMSRAAFAAESYDNCAGFITTLPTTISTPGTWCLKQNLSTAMTTGNAIIINNSNVTIDCNNFSISGLPGGAATAARGITAVNRLNATVRHCGIRGFQYGIYMYGASSGSHAIEDNQLDSNTYIGMWIEGDGSVVRHNLVSDTGGSATLTSPKGIYTRYSVDVLDNNVSGVLASGSGSGYGIYSNLNPNGSINSNRVRGVVKGVTGIAYGIYNSTAGRVTLEGNDVVGDASAGSNGLYCASSTARAKNNVVSGFATALKNCGDAGSNDVTP